MRTMMLKASLIFWKIEKNSCGGGGWDLIIRIPPVVQI